MAKKWRLPPSDGRRGLSQNRLVIASCVPITPVTLRVDNEGPGLSVSLGKMWLMGSETSRLPSSRTLRVT